MEYKATSHFIEKFSFSLMMEDLYHQTKFIRLALGKKRFWEKSVFLSSSLLILFFFLYVSNHL